MDTLFFNFSRIQFLWKFRGLTHKRNVQQPEDTGSRAVARNGHELAVNQAIRKKTATWLFFFSFSRTISRASFHSRLNRDTCSGAIYNRNSGWNFYKKFFFLLNFDRTRVSKGFRPMSGSRVIIGTTRLVVGNFNFYIERRCIV